MNERRAIELIQDRLRAHFEVLKIVLFGSRARGDQSEDSDFDVLVIANSDIPFVERQGRAMLALRHKGFPWTFWSIHPRKPGQPPRSSALPFIGQSVKERSCMPSSATQQWLDKATEDERAAEALKRQSLWTPAAYHIQQSAEKFIKAALVEVGVAPPRTHDLGDLIGLFSRSNASAGSAQFSRPIESTRLAYPLSWSTKEYSQGRRPS